MGSLRRVWRRRSLIPITLFLLCLWLGRRVLLVAKLNTVLDGSQAPVQHDRKIVAARLAISGAGGRTSFGSKSRQCMVTLDAPVGAVRTAWLPSGDCAGIRPGEDGLSLQMRPGALGMPWVEASSLVRDPDGFKARPATP